jgi:predicted transcriptional regulator/DNA-binding XRE family transcriptional regulator
MTKVHRDKVVNAVRISGSDAGRVVGRSLKAIRELAGLTQSEMAERLQVGQAAISKIERRGDVQLSSLQKYVHALGATLRISALFSPNSDIFDQFDQPVGDYCGDSNQLVFPLFAGEEQSSPRDVVLSIRPKYSEKIINGKKTIELRRRFPLSAASGRIAYIYSTSPVRAMVGLVEIAEVVKLPVNQIWNDYSGLAFVTKEKFDEYFFGVDEGFALRFVKPRSFSQPLSLADLRQKCGFEPPQSFLYPRPNLQKVLRDEHSSLCD